MATTEEEHYASFSNLLPQFTNIPSIHKAWFFNSNTLGMFSITQPDLLTNNTKTLIMSCNVDKQENDGSVVEFLWTPFPIEMSGVVSMIVPSPSGSKLLVIRNQEEKEGGVSCCFEIWSCSCLEKEFHIPQSMHGSVYNDG
ncbi:acylamino-acid-releasing enzyme-like protein, partial [Trifolium pratense]